MELSGTWRAHAADGELAKQFPDSDFDDASWTEVELPHHWRQSDAFAESDGPVLYRRAFSLERPATGRRQFLEIDGCFYYGDVWVDGDYAGTTEGYYVPHAFEITDACTARAEHVVALEVACPPQRDRTAKRAVTGVFGHWNGADPDFNPGGPWRPIRVAESGPVRIVSFRMLCIEASIERGRLQCVLTLDAGDTALDAVLSATITGPDGTELLVAVRDATLAAGENELTWTLIVDGAPRWWPHALGLQPTCNVDVSVEVAGDVSDRRVVRTAFREIRAHGWQFTVNGERLFLKGSNYAPTRMALAGATRAEIRQDVVLARGANLDFLRVHGHVARPELYEAADDQGLLLWQDLPLKWGYARGVRKQAVRQARAMVDLLGHHPSVFLWCAHASPVAYEREPGEPWSGGKLAKYAATTVLPTWTKEVLDTSVARALSRRDPTRQTIRHSGSLHPYFGWYLGTLTDLAPALRRWPRLGRFVSEFGAQAVPNANDWMDATRWPNLDWDELSTHHALQREEMARVAPPEDAKNFEEWRETTQAYQAALLQLQIEDLRRLKYSPTGGFAQFSFADPEPAVSWSVLDHDRVAKRGYDAIREACRPVLPMIEPRAGLVHVVNDTRAILEGAIVEAAVDGRTTRWTGTVPTDGITFVGRVDVTEAVDVEVSVEHPATGRLVNRYPLLVLRAL